MASVTEKPQSKSPQPPASDTQRQLVDQQIGRTRRALKFVDLTAGAITLTIGVLIYLLTMSVLEHWVIPGGWSDAARAFLFAALVFGCVLYSWRTFWPLLRQPINPAYAALAIEQSSPSLKNSLLNLLLLRDRKREMSRQVYQAIETQAAQGLTQVRMETVVDRSTVLRLGYILVTLTAVCVAYRVLSPKDLFSSAGRVLLPWSDIAVPSRVTISNVTPGDTKTARGDQLKVTAEVLGLEADEPVQLLLTTSDKQIVKQQIPMSVSDSGTLFSCKVPARIGGDSRGVQQDFTYWIEAGDVRSPKFEVNVFARPTMVVNRLRYDYPAYTGYPSREVEHTGDIRAVEGTRVTLFAQANKPIKAAHVDFAADGRNDLLMNSTDQQASVTFLLALREDRRTPEHHSYVLKYTTSDGNQNQLPPKYQIDVQPDYTPEIQLLLPEEALLEVALNQEVNFELEARDPDFALGQVMLIGKVGKDVKLQERLLTLKHTGKFVGKLRKTPEQMGLKPGDLLEYWGAAADNRRPEPNLAYSAHRKLRVVGPWRGNEQGEQNQDGEGQRQQGESGDSSEGEGGQDGQAGGGEQGNSSDGEGQDGAEGQAGSGEQGGQDGENQQSQDGGQGESDGQPNDGNDAQGGANGNSPNQNGDGNSEPNDSGQDDTGQSEGEQGGEQQPSDEAAGGEGGQGKVSSEGDDDGKAFERMAEHFDEQAGQSSDGQSKSDTGAADGRRDSDQSSDGNDSSEDAQQGNPTDGNSDAEQDRDSDGSDGDSAQGDDAEGEAGTSDQGDGDQSEQQGQEGESPDQGMSPKQGDAGAGDRSGDQQGSPETDGSKKPQDKQGDGSDGPEQQNSEAPADGRDQSESDSEGGQSGDRSGGGKEGAGQQADESGKGGAGQNETADEGAGRSSEQGDGETGEQAGDQDQADGQTGESSNDQQGNGSKQSDQAGEQPNGDSAADGQSGQSGDQPSAGEPSAGEPAAGDDQQSSDQQSPPGEADSSDAEGDSGDPAGTGGNSSPPPASDLQDADDPNLKYAEKQTDLILDRLEDQLNKKKVDKNLLEKLGWTQDELRRFVDRWKGLKSQAAEDPSASDELKDSLRSLGMKPNRRSGYNSKTTKDKLRDLNEAYRVRVPAEYQDQINRYIKGTARAQEKE